MDLNLLFIVTCAVVLLAAVLGLFAMTASLGSRHKAKRPRSHRRR